MVNKKYYVHIWYVRKTNEIFYVGKGSGNRYKSMKDRNSYFKNIRKKYDCDYKIVKYFDNETEQAVFVGNMYKYGNTELTIRIAKGCMVA